MSASNLLLHDKIKQWEEASASLLATFKDYMDLCLSLTSTSLGNADRANGLAARIDSTFEIVLDQLINASSTLGQARNKLVPLIHQLPEEILVAIFVNVVFDSAHPEPSASSSIKREVLTTYRRLYGLIGVCSSWRDIIMTRGAFWSLIPIIPSTSPWKHPPFELCLKRARESKLHLVAISRTPDSSKDLIDVLTEYCTRLHIINFNLVDHEVIVDGFSKLLQGNPRSLTELSIHCTRLGASSSWIPEDEDYVIPLDHPQQKRFASLVGALKAFRVRGAHFHWQTLEFSSRLVELHIDSITLGFDHAIYPFLRALSAASGLRDLKIIQLDTFFEPESTLDTKSLSPIVLPNLQSLYVENIFFNTLKLLLPMIAPGSHRLTLFLDSGSVQNNLFDHDVEMMETSELARVGITDLFEVLERVPVDTLMLNGRWEQWPKIVLLPIFLRAFPALKTLKIHNWEFDDFAWSSLRRPSSIQTDPQEPPDSFPALENLQLTGARISAYDSFQEMIASHPLQRFVLGTNNPTPLVGADWQQGTLAEDNPILNRVKVKVPDFRLIDSGHVPSEFQTDHHTWRLW